MPTLLFTETNRRIAPLDGRQVAEVGAGFANSCMEHQVGNNPPFLVTQRDVGAGPIPDVELHRLRNELCKTRIKKQRFTPCCCGQVLWIRGDYRVGVGPLFKDEG